MTVKPKIETKSEYNEAVNQAELVDLRLVKTSWVVDLSLLDDIEELDKRIDQSLSGLPHFDSETGLLMGQVTCQLWMPNKMDAEDSGIQEGEPEMANVVACEASYVVAFRVPQTLASTDAHRFFASTSGFAVWPYFRSHIANLAAQSRIELPPLPLKTLLQRVPEEKFELLEEAPPPPTAQTSGT
jgi:hypothetical protein